MSEPKTNWNLKLLYSSPSDPQIEKDVNKIKKAYIDFEKKYVNETLYLKDEKALLATLKDYEKFETIVSPMKPTIYFWLTKELDSNNHRAMARLTKLEDEFTKYANRVLFFELNLGKIDTKLQRVFLKSPTLKKYHYHLQKIFETSKHNLSEPEERILNLKSMPSHSMWVDGVERVLNKQTIKFKGKVLPIAEAINMGDTLSLKNRRSLKDIVNQKLYEMSDFAESEINAIVYNKKINDTIRKFEHPYSATILSYENDEKTVLNLVDTVTANFHLSHRFYNLKKDLLKQPYLDYADRSAKIGSVSKEITFREACTRYRSILSGIDEEYADIFDSFLKNGQIDVMPKVGKSGGAYCMGVSSLPTFVLLNHTNSIRSFMTLAHEMGHAIHTEMSKKQPILYDGYTTSVAETASTLFEGLAFDVMFESLTPKEQVIALHDKINDDIATIFRQIAFFNFENELHLTIRDRGSLSKEEIASLLNKHMKSYLGPAFRMKDLDGYFFVYISHFRRFFYVYSYTYGQLISKAICRKYKEDPKFTIEIKKFLTAGCSQSPEGIFKSIGIDTTNTSFFKAGLKQLEGDIKRLEQLTRSAKK